MSDEMDKYIILKYLDEERRILGLPIDEFIPITVIIVFGFIAKFLMLGILLSAVLFASVRSIKKNRGRCALMALIYWNGNESVGKTLFRSFPKSSDRYWI